MPYLRTTRSKLQQDLAPNAIGGGIMNYIEGSQGGALAGRLGKFFGGFVMFSIYEDNSAILSRASDSILASYYGVTFVSNVLDGGAGFKVVPIAAYPISQLSQPFFYHPTLSLGTGSIVFIAINKLSMSTGPSEIIMTLAAASFSHRICVIGFIASTPFGPWS